jgi:hypothetical protein
MTSAGIGSDINLLWVSSSDVAVGRNDVLDVPDGIVIAEHEIGVQRASPRPDKPHPGSG